MKITQLGPDGSPARRYGAFGPYVAGASLSSPGRGRSFAAAVDFVFATPGRQRSFVDAGGRAFSTPGRQRVFAAPKEVA